ncbi:MAG TPA: hypothetical protein VLA89_13595 [Gemmatimonadales bacterium]|nr:hypothetical protein [Gemmatimonadales bacterium]
MLRGITVSKGKRSGIAIGLLSLVLGAAPAAVRGQQHDSVGTAAAVRDTTCADTTDTSQAAKRQKVRRRSSMDHNEVAAPRVDNIPLEGTDSGFIPIPGTGHDSISAAACASKRKPSRDSTPQ